LKWLNNQAQIRRKNDSNDRTGSSEHFNEIKNRIGTISKKIALALFVALNLVFLPVGCPELATVSILFWCVVIMIWPLLNLIDLVIDEKDF